MQQFEVQNLKFKYWTIKIRIFKFNDERLMTKEFGDGWSPIVFDCNQANWLIGTFRTFGPFRIIRLLPWSKSFDYSRIRSVATVSFLWFLMISNRQCLLDTLQLSDLVTRFWWSIDLHTLSHTLEDPNWNRQFGQWNRSNCSVKSIRGILDFWISSRRKFLQEIWRRSTS